MTHTIPLKALRPGLPKVANAVATRFDRYIVTKRGHPVMVLMNPEDFEGLLETIEILSDRAAIRRIKQARKEAKAGKTAALEDLRHRLERA
ncbi:MAG: type II toxin-antitoxin system Phd/YefM family antitoxin [Elusimicrobia bacterium]|nr:type II toxin-antitoxin system Phd/YefM family antitoxin [Elusimicrobiota bacterium]